MFSRPFPTSGCCVEQVDGASDVANTCGVLVTAGGVGYWGTRWVCDTDTPARGAWGTLSIGGVVYVPSCLY